MLDENSLILVLEKGVISLKEYQLILDYYYRVGAINDWFGCVYNGSKYGVQDIYDYIFDYRKRNEEVYSILVKDMLEN